MTESQNRMSQRDKELINMSNNNSMSTGRHSELRLSDIDKKKMPVSPSYEAPLSPNSLQRIAQPSPKQGDRHYNRMKYYSALKTNARESQRETEVQKDL